MISPQHLKHVTQTLNKFPQLHDTQIFLFGSRASHDHHHPYSDIDLGIDGGKPLPASLISELETTFEDSDLPYVVEIIDFATVDDQFKSVALQHTIPIQLSHD